MFPKLNEIWAKYGFEIVVGGCLLIIIITALFRRGKRGSWNDRIYGKYQEPQSRRPPQTSRGELECKRVLESIFKKPFNKTRPDFLRNPVTSTAYDSNNLELDCYNPELRLAVEYNGIQHYKYIPYFHKTRDAFQNQKYRDHIKRELCQKAGITLIEVPHTVKVEEIEDFIRDKLRQLR